MERFRAVLREGHGLKRGAALGNGRRLCPLCPSVSRLSAPCCGDATAVSGLTGRPVSEIWRVGVMKKVWLIWLMVLHGSIRQKRKLNRPNRPRKSLGVPGGSDSKEPTYSAGDLGSTLGLGRSPEVNGNPLQYSCLENPMHRGAWWATVPGVAE